MMRVRRAYRDADGDGRLPWGHDPSLVDSFHLESVGGPHAHGCQVLKVQGLQHSQLPGDGVQREQLSGRFGLDPVRDIGEKVRVHRLSGGARPGWGGVVELKKQATAPKKKKRKKKGRTI